MLLSTPEGGAGGREGGLHACMYHGHASCWPWSWPPPWPCFLLGSRIRRGYAFHVEKLDLAICFSCIAILYIKVTFEYGAL